MEPNKPRFSTFIQDILPFALLLIAGLWVFSPWLDHQNLLLQGDHGRDLYVFKKTLDGALPYRDYWWVYGPLMPFFYALFFKIFGVMIPSILIGKIFLSLLGGLFFYLSLSLFAPPLLSIVGTLWFWTYQPNFFFTYNHAGGIAITLGAIYFALKYIQESKRSSLVGGWICILILCLIKINIGVFTWMSFMAAVLAADFANKTLTSDQKRFYLLANGLGFIIVVGIYALLIYGLPFYYIRQCFPYLRSDHPYYSTILNSSMLLWEWFTRSLTSSWVNVSIGILGILCFAQTILRLFDKDTSFRKKRILWLSLSFLILFCVLNLHEFIDSGIRYRTFWVTQAKFLFFFIVLALATKQFSRLLRYLLLTALFCVLLLENGNLRIMIGSFKQNSHYLSMERAKVFVGNDPEWVNTVTQTTEFLKTHLKEGDGFFALPYDAFYYYLTGKDSPTRQLIFFEHILINAAQEKDVIKSLEDKHINYVLLSSRQKASKEEGLGTFGKTYCPILGAYIFEHFEPVATFGEWDKEPGCAWNHGTRIFKRKILK